MYFKDIIWALRGKFYKETHMLIKLKKRSSNLMFYNFNLLILIFVLELLVKVFYSITFIKKMTIPENFHSKGLIIFQMK